MGELGENFGVEPHESQKKIRGDRSKDEEQQISIGITDGHRSFEECRNGDKAPTNFKVELYSEATLWSSVHWTRIISISNDGSKSHGYHIQTVRLRRNSSLCSVCLYPGNKGRSHYGITLSNGRRRGEREEGREWLKQLHTANRGMWLRHCIQSGQTEPVATVSTIMFATPGCLSQIIAEESACPERGTHVLASLRNPTRPMLRGRIAVTFATWQLPKLHTCTSTCPRHGLLRPILEAPPGESSSPSQWHNGATKPKHSPHQGPSGSAPTKLCAPRLCPSGVPQILMPCSAGGSPNPRQTVVKLGPWHEQLCPTRHTLPAANLRCSTPVFCHHGHGIMGPSWLPLLEHEDKYTLQSWILSSSKKTKLVNKIRQHEDLKSAVVVGLSRIWHSLATRWGVHVELVWCCCTVVTSQPGTTDLTCFSSHWRVGPKSHRKQFFLILVHSAFCTRFVVFHACKKSDQLVHDPLVLLAPEWSVVERALCRWCGHQILSHASTRASCRWIAPGWEFQWSLSGGSCRRSWAHNKLLIGRSAQGILFREHPHGRGNGRSQVSGRRSGRWRENTEESTARQTITQAQDTWMGWREQTLEPMWYHPSLWVRVVNEKKVTCEVTCEVYCLQVLLAQRLPCLCDALASCPFLRILKGEVAFLKTSLIRCAIVRDTNHRRMSPATMPLTPPVGFLRVVSLPKRSARTAASGAIPCANSFAIRNIAWKSLELSVREGWIRPGSRHSSVGGVPVVDCLDVDHMEEEVQDKVQAEVKREEQGTGETHEQGVGQRENKPSTNRTHAWPSVWGDAHKHILEPWCECTSLSMRIVQEKKWRVRWTPPVCYSGSPSTVNDTNCHKKEKDLGHFIPLKILSWAPPAFGRVHQESFEEECHLLYCCGDVGFAISSPDSRWKRFLSETAVRKSCRSCVGACRLLWSTAWLPWKLWISTWLSLKSSSNKQRLLGDGIYQNEDPISILSLVFTHHMWWCMFWPMDLVYVCVKPQMRLYVCHQMRLLNPQFNGAHFARLPLLASLARFLTV